MTLTRGSDGETLSTFSVKLDPTEVYFAEKKQEPGQAKLDSFTVSVNVGKRNLYLITVSDLVAALSLCTSDTRPLSSHQLSQKPDATQFSDSEVSLQP